MEAIIHATKEQIETLRNMDVEIVCTDQDAVILPPLTHRAIQEEVRRYLRLFGSSMKNANRIQALTKDVIYRIEKALEVDGSLSWDEVWEIIGACYSRQGTIKKRKNNARREKFNASNKIHLPRR